MLYSERKRYFAFSGQTDGIKGCPGICLEGVVCAHAASAVIRVKAVFGIATQIADEGSTKTS